MFIIWTVWIVCYFPFLISKPYVFSEDGKRMWEVHQKRDGEGG